MRLVEELNLTPVKGDVGIEIEMEGIGITRVDVSLHWNSTVDGSLRGECIEWVTRGPISAAHINKVLDYLSYKIKKNNSTLSPSGRCGTHIHINCQELTRVQVVNFISIYLIIEDILIKSFGSAREGNMFCLRCKDADYFVSNLIYAIKKGSFTHLPNNIRYSSINPAALVKYGSLEFRAMPTPTDFSLISNWAHMFLRMREAAKVFTNTRDIVEGISNQGQIPFLQNIFGEYLQLIECANMEDMVVDGCRRVQTIAYQKWPEKRETPKKNKNTELEQILRRPPELQRAQQAFTFNTTDNGTINTINWDTRS